MKRAATVAVLAVLAVTSLGLASASSLDVSSRRVSTSAVTAPCPGIVTTAANPTNTADTRFNRVAVTLPAGCGTRSLQVAVRDGTSWRTSAATTITGSGVVQLSGSYTADSTITMQATVDGWDLPGTWSYEPAGCAVTDGSGATCSADVVVFVGSKPGGGSFTYYDVAVTTTSTTPVPWQVTIRTSHPDLPGAPTRLGNSTLDAYNDGATAWSNAGSVNDVNRVSPCTDAPGVIVVAGRPSGPAGNRFETVVAGRARLFSVVLNYNVVPYYDIYAPGCV